jgi:hypothetical protein
MGHLSTTEEYQSVTSPPKISEEHQLTRPVDLELEPWCRVEKQVYPRLNQPLRNTSCHSLHSLVV